MNRTEWLIQTGLISQNRASLDSLPMPLLRTAVPDLGTVA